MFKLLTIIALFGGFCGCQNDDLLLNKLTNKDGRQKRLLFYDEEGNLVKTFGNSLRYLDQNEQRNPLYWSFLNALMNPLRPTILKETPIAYMIPVSDAVIQHINTDPVYQNKLFFLTTKDPIVEKNAVCDGKRVQIPSPKLCSNFLNCWDGWAFEQECPEGLMFSSNGYCDYAYQVDCNSRKIKENPEPRCNRDFQTYRNSENCNEFFVCVNSYPVRFKCPADLSYNEYLGVCDYSFRVECNATQDSTGLSTTTPAAPATEPTAGPSGPTPAQDNLSPINGPMLKSQPDFNTFNKVEYKKQSFTSTHVAVSRQDAIKQLSLQSIASINTQ